MKPKYNKAYLILHDGEKVLIGTGGKSGGKKKTRQGYHLPGGSVDKLDEDDVVTTVMRELEEETGISSEQVKIQKTVTSDEIKGTNILFVVATVKSVDELAKDFKRPKVKNEYDEPFEELESISIEECWDDKHFSEDYWTDWFGSGLKAAFAK